VTPIRLLYGPVDESDVCVIHFGFVFSFFVAVEWRVLCGYNEFHIGRHDEGPPGVYIVFLNDYPNES